MTASAFLRAISATYQRNPFNEYEHIIGGAVVQFQRARNPLMVELAFIKSIYPRTGAASLALKLINKLADECGVEVELYVVPLKHYAVDKKIALNKAQLRNWYQRHGFVVTLGTGYMTRKPQKEV